MLGAVIKMLHTSCIGFLNFPANAAIFQKLASQSIVLFHAATILSQLVFSCNGTKFIQYSREMFVEDVLFYAKCRS